MNDTQLLHYLRAFLASDDKPETLNPLDIVQTVRLLLQLADEKDAYMSQDTLAMQLCSSVDAIKRSQDRLSCVGWLVIRKGGYRGRTNRYAINLDKLPQADLARTVVSPATRRYASRYGLYVKANVNKRFMKLWPQQWAFAIQRLCDRTDGGLPRVGEIVNFALRNPRYQKYAFIGPSALRKIWKQLCQDYEKATGDLGPKRNQEALKDKQSRVIQTASQNEDAIEAELQQESQCQPENQ